MCILGVLYIDLRVWATRTVDRLSQAVDCLGILWEEIVDRLEKLSIDFPHKHKLLTDGWQLLIGFANIYHSTFHYSIGLRDCIPGGSFDMCAWTQVCRVIRSTSIASNVNDYVVEMWPDVISICCIAWLLMRVTNLSTGYLRASARDDVVWALARDGVMGGLAHGGVMVALARVKDMF